MGETLTADASSVADADGLTNVAYRYQWLRLDGASETNIGTGSSSYTLVAEDSGKTIKVRVTFTDDAGNAEDLTSDGNGGGGAHGAGRSEEPESLGACSGDSGRVVGSSRQRRRLRRHRIPGAVEGGRRQLDGLRGRV